MSPRVRVIRFARVTGAAAPGPGAADPAVAAVLLQEQPAPAGQIILRDGAWHYEFADGSRSALVSTHSRQDLEFQITLFYFGALPAAAPECREPSFQKTG
jgi:hypothetical protein